VRRSNVAESRDPQEEESAESQTPSLDLQEDNDAMRVLASNPSLWRAHLEMVDAIREDGRPGLRLDFGAGESMVSVTSTAGNVRYSYPETEYEDEVPLGRNLLSNTGFAVLDDRDGGEP
jgi:hypothetical protein